MNLKEMEARWKEELPTESNGCVRKRRKPKKWNMMLDNLTNPTTSFLKS